MEIKVGQVGVGTWGRYHCELLSKMDGVELVGLYDINTKRCGKTAADYGTREFSSLEELLDNVEAVVVTAPTEKHYDISRQAVVLGKHLFVEKPICDSVADAEDLVRLASQHGVVLQVGHIERFNPAFRAACLNVVSPAYIEVHRLAPYSTRGIQASVVMDLMVHDLDLILKLVGQEVVGVEATGFTRYSAATDFANARLNFAGGCVANVTASRISEVKRREMEIRDAQGVLHLDFVDRRARRIPLAGQPGAAGVTGDLVDPLRASQENLLQNELVSFFDCLRNGRKPGVDGFEGLEALKLAAKVQTRIDGN